MKHKNTPRGGASNETRDLLGEYEEETREDSPELCNCSRCAEARRTPDRHVVRWLCTCCNNLLDEHPQVEGLDPVTLKAVGACCKHILPQHLQSKAMPVKGCADPKPGQFDQRSTPRPDSDPGASLGKEK